MGDLEKAEQYLSVAADLFPIYAPERYKGFSAQQSHFGGHP
jgi:hypothetical protein